MNVFEYILNVFMGTLLIGMLVYGIYGYLKIVNPDEYQELLEETYVIPFDDIPIFITG